MRKFCLNNGSDNKKNNLVFVLFGLVILFALIVFFAYTRIINKSVIINEISDAPMELLVYVGGEEASGFPTRSAGYIYDSITCKNGSSGIWNNDTWSLDMNFKKGDACIIYFEVALPYIDTILAGSDPILDSKMVPVNIADTGVITVADVYEDGWYNYSESKWANAVIVDPTFTTLDPGTIIPMSVIKQMYVWIPRYEYKKSSIVNASESIEINFVPVTKTSTTEQVNNADVIVHPAFCWGNYCQTDRSHADNIELSGIWVGKFEIGWQDDFVDNASSPYNNNVETTYIIKPNVNSAHHTNVSTLFYNIQDTAITYSMDATTDIHLIKNTEWGAVAYLSQSQYGICEDDVTCSVKIENNNYFSSTNGYDVVTGCGGNDIVYDVLFSGVNICPSSNRWETTNGIKSSTTHNITGIYDMVGGRWEYVMSNMQNSSGNFYSLGSGFVTAPDAKYYDSYVYGTSDIDFTRGLYGDATIELNPSGNSMPNWNSDHVNFINLNRSWFMRGARSGVGIGAGIWVSGDYDGYAYEGASTRMVGIVGY